MLSNTAVKPPRTASGPPSGGSVEGSAASSVAPASALRAIDRMERGAEGKTISGRLTAKDLGFPFENLDQARDQYAWFYHELKFEHPVYGSGTAVVVFYPANPFDPSYKALQALDQANGGAHADLIRRGNHVGVAVQLHLPNFPGDQKMFEIQSFAPDPAALSHNDWKPGEPFVLQIGDSVLKRTIDRDTGLAHFDLHVDAKDTTGPLKKVKLSMHLDAEVPGWKLGDGSVFKERSSGKAHLWQVLAPMTKGTIELSYEDKEHGPITIARTEGHGYADKNRVEIGHRGDPALDGLSFTDKNPGWQWYRGMIDLEDGRKLGLVMVDMKEPFPGGFDPEHQSALRRTLVIFDPEKPGKPLKEIVEYRGRETGALRFSGSANASLETGRGVTELPVEYSKRVTIEAPSDGVKVSFADPQKVYDFGGYLRFATDSARATIDGKTYPLHMVYEVFDIAQFSKFESAVADALTRAAAVKSAYSLLRATSWLPRSLREGITHGLTRLKTWWDYR